MEGKDNNQVVEVSGSRSEPKKREAAKKATRSSPRLARKSSSSKEAQTGPEDIPSKRPKVATVDRKETNDVMEQSSSVTGPGPSSATCKPLGRSPLRPEVNEVEDNDTEGNVIEDGATVPNNTEYRLKWISHGGRKCPIVMQNQNGPCPLIAIVNIMLLEKKILLSEKIDCVTEDELLLHIRSAILETLPKGSKDINPDLVQNAQDAISLLPGLHTGLNVNIRFSGVKNFEYTPECLVFDTLKIGLYHGWIIDPQSTELASAVGNQSYNQLVENIILKKASENPEEVAKALLAENFLDATASQLTVHGLCELNSAINPGQLAVLFRNNHFTVLYKHQNSLCQLVTDQGFLEEADIVWETLSTINGDEVFLDCCFENSASKRKQSDPSEETQISRDFLVALSLQDEQNIQQDKEFEWDAYGNALGASGMTSDVEPARKVRVEEQRQVASRSGSPSGDEPVPSTSRASSSQRHQEETPKTRDWKCVIC